MEDENKIVHNKIINSSKNIVSNKQNKIDRINPTIQSSHNLSNLENEQIYDEK